MMAKQNKIAAFVGVGVFESPFRFLFVGILITLKSAFAVLENKRHEFIRPADRQI